MKKMYPLSIVVALLVVLSVSEVSAQEAAGRVNVDVKARSGEAVEVSRIRDLALNGGIVGVVTEKNADTISVRARDGKMYTVTMTDAKIRYTNDTDISVGEMVFVQGVLNGSTIAATMIVNTPANTEPKPSAEELRKAVAGTVTAKSDTSITVSTANKETYTVSTEKAVVRKGNTEVSLSDVVVGSFVVVKGSVSGTTISATEILAMRLPDAANPQAIRGKVVAKIDDTITILLKDGTTQTVSTRGADIEGSKNTELSVGKMVVVKEDGEEGRIQIQKQGLFQRIGSFWKNVFSKKAQ